MKKAIVFILLSLVISIPLFAVNLSDEEIQGIILMREEEKLARDVYLALYEKWGINSFYNIAQSEQKHFDSVGNELIDYFNLDDPVKNDIPGVFSSEQLQNLYYELLEKGLSSIQGAVEVGLTIEDLDIYDLQDLIDSTDNPTIENVYKNLQSGSVNHMGAFFAQAEKYSVEYQFQFISQEQYMAAVNGEKIPSNNKNMNENQNRNTVQSQNQSQNGDCTDCDQDQNMNQNQNGNNDSNNNQGQDNGQGGSNGSGNGSSGKGKK